MNRGYGVHFSPSALLYGGTQEAYSRECHNLTSLSYLKTDIYAQQSQGVHAAVTALLSMAAPNVSCGENVNSRGCVPKEPAVLRVTQSQSLDFPYPRKLNLPA